MNNEEMNQEQNQEEVKQEEVKQEENQEQEQEKKYTDEDVNRLIDKKYAELKTKAEKEVEEAKKEAEKQAEEAKKYAELTAKEKIEYERDKLQQELDDLKREKALNEMKTTARTTLSEEGIQVSDELLSVIVTDNADVTKASISSFATLFKEAVDKEVTDRMRGATPKRGVGKNALTKEEILATKDPLERQRKIAENLHLFK